MALQIHHVCRPIPPSPSSTPIGPPSSWPTKYSTVSGEAQRSVKLVKTMSRKTTKKSRYSVAVRSSLETSGTAVVAGQVTEVDKDTFWPIVNAAGDKTVVLDMYTQWCGPCKIISPKYQELAEKHLDVVFLKLDCNQENKPLAKELGIKVVPTFKILHHGKIVKEVTGAKLDKLVAAMEEILSFRMNGFIVTIKVGRETTTSRRDLSLETSSNRILDQTVFVSNHNWII